MDKTIEVCKSKFNQGGYVNSKISKEEFEKMERRLERLKESVLPYITTDKYIKILNHDYVN